MPKISMAVLIAALTFPVFASSAVRAPYAQNFGTIVATGQIIGSADTATIGWRSCVNATADRTIDSRIFATLGVRNPNTGHGCPGFFPNGKPQFMAAVITFPASFDSSGAAITC